MTILHRAQKINTISERAQENYIWHERQITLTAHNDKYAKSKDLTYEVVQIGYHKTSLVIANNGRAVSYKKLAKEKINLIRKLQRFNASPQKMAANHAKQLRREHIFNHALMTAFYFRLLSPQHLRIPTQKCWASIHISRSTNCLSRHKHWVYHIEGLPRPGWKSPNSQTAILKNVAGSLWITVRNYHLVRMKIRVLKTISFGWIIARLQPGAILTLEQAPIISRLSMQNSQDIPFFHADHGMIWFPFTMRVNYTLRLFMFKQLRQILQINDYDYHYFKITTQTLPQSLIYP